LAEADFVVGASMNRFDGLGGVTRAVQPRLTSATDIHHIAQCACLAEDP
jgi:hypothetical protein